MDTKYFAILVLASIVVGAKGDPSDYTNSSRQGKVFSLFQIIRFTNGPCNGTGTQSGTCYTQAECQTRNGMSIGTCASGYGVCCSFSISCGGMSRENCTFFTSANNLVNNGECIGTICPVSDRICQLRLDFNTFAITGPSTISNIVTGIQFAAPTNDVGLGVSNSEVTQCLTDTFSVLSQNGNNPPTICGNNNNQHMYLDADGSDCTPLVFQFGMQGGANRAFNIKVSQYACDFNNLAPSGCTQYFFDPNNMGSVQSYNFAGGLHLANQVQTNCVRRNANTCRICWFAVNPLTDFDVSGALLNSGRASADVCCGGGIFGGNTFGFDCVTIPGARTGKQNVPNFSRICGRGTFTNMGSNILTAIATGTTCSTSAPFRLTFRSDNFEVAGGANTESLNKDAGFRLGYKLDSTIC